MALNSAIPLYKTLHVHEPSENAFVSIGEIVPLPVVPLPIHINKYSSYITKLPVEYAVDGCLVVVYLTPDFVQIHPFVVPVLSLIT